MTERPPLLLSLNEIETTAVKAARGAGFAWGLAEEVGLAARWLAANGCDAAAALVDLLEDAEGAIAAECPIRQGAYLSDRGDWAEPGLDRRHVRHPFWLAPFLAGLATARGKSGATRLTWPGAEIVIAADGMLDRADGDMRTRGPVVVEIAACAPPETAPRERPHGTAASPLLWDRIERLAARTYVPASDQSRLSGAGSGAALDD